MKRKELIRLINKQARIHGKKVTYREGGSHTKVTVGISSVRIPRHSILNIETSRSIMRELDSEFGKGWSKL